jgi:hypothetical protein
VTSGDVRILLLRRILEFEVVRAPTGCKKYTMWGYRMIFKKKRETKQEKRKENERFPTLQRDRCLGLKAKWSRLKKEEEKTCKAH